MKTKVAIIGSRGIPANYGGFETLVEHLTREKHLEFNFTVYCSKTAYLKRPKNYNGSRLKYLPLNANGIQSIPYDGISMFDAIRYADQLLILGVSGCIVLPFLKLFTSKKIIVNIDGLEWKRDKWGKIAKWFYKLSEKVAVRSANVIIADNKEIQKYVKEEYNKEAELIAYGADHSNAEDIDTSTYKQFPFLQEEYAFKVCRIEPENNIHMVLEAFSEFSELNLVIIGNWNNSDYGKRLKIKYDDLSNVFLLDPIYDQKRLNEIRSNCHVYIHGHSAGGTNPSLIEAMYLKLPVLAYDVNYNKETTANKALYFNNKQALIRILHSLDKKILHVISREMYQVAQERYTWNQIANQYARLFEGENKVAKDQNNMRQPVNELAERFAKKINY